MQRLLLGVALTAALVSAQQPPGSSFSVGVIQNWKEFSGSGCYYQAPSEPDGSEKFLFIFDLLKAVINVNGKNVFLKRVRSVECKTEVGSPATEWYEGNSMKVKLDSVVTWVCPANDVNCETTRVKATIVVTRRSQQKVVSVKGFCGS